jgi:hypothetical protein
MLLLGSKQSYTLTSSTNRTDYTTSIARSPPARTPWHGRRRWHGMCPCRRHSRTPPRMPARRKWPSFGQGLKTTRRRGQWQDGCRSSSSSVAESGLVHQSAVPVGGEGGIAAGILARQRDAEIGDASTREGKATEAVTPAQDLRPGRLSIIARPRQQVGTHFSLRQVIFVPLQKAAA